MATITQLVDDLTGEAGADVHPRKFAIDGVDYEIDLSDENYAGLCAAVADYTANARKAGSVGRKSGKPTRNFAPTIDRSQNQAMREWARQNGYSVNDRGRISVEIQNAYHRAGGQSAQATAASSAGSVPSPAFSEAGV